MIDHGLGVQLRRVDGKDLDDLFEWRNDQRIYRWCRQNAPLHWATHTAWYDWQAEDDSVSMFVVVAGRSSNPMGVCGLTSIDMVNRRAEFSLYLAPAHQGGGVGRAALSTLLMHGFNDVGLNRIWGEVFEKNPALNMFVDVGFEIEGERKEFYFRDGNFINATLISIDRDRLLSKLYGVPAIQACN